MLLTAATSSILRKTYLCGEHSGCKQHVTYIMPAALRYLAVTLTAVPEGPEFNSQQPHGGSQPFVMGSDALFWCV